ncbi:MAG: hypothetical protein [Enterobacteria phage RP5]|uniref:Uncharacterized protein n=1 Tax=Salmonella phage vB_SalS_SA001 TaxID=2739751 RepID=A0A7D3QKP0_9CAUD|nr:hypothetical protein ACSA001_0615 [Salmonella phage vB_SalS_SA001]ULG02049.1 MAG: hypothetical protein [Enterobacteria phage RP5]
MISCLCTCKAVVSKTRTLALKTIKHSSVVDGETSLARAEARSIRVKEWFS